MSEISDMINIYRLGAEGSYFMIKGSVNLVLFLLQQYKKMERANLIGRGEVRDFEKFITATEGRFQLLNIPTEDGKQLEEMKKDLDQMGITYTILPDLNVGDGVTTIAYYIDHTPQMEGWYRQFCTSQLTGGEMDYERLQRLTEGQVSIVNIPWEADTLDEEKGSIMTEKKTESKERVEEEREETEPKKEEQPEAAREKRNQEKQKTAEELKKEQEEKLKKRMERRQEKLEKFMEDLSALHINFTILPDLNVGDGNIQVAYASADAPQMNVWYENYRDQLLKEGKMAGSMKEMDLNDYMDSGKTDAKAYASRYSQEMRGFIEHQARQNAFYPDLKKQGGSPDFFQEQGQRFMWQPIKQQAMTTDSLSYQAGIQRPGTRILSIDIGNVTSVDASTFLARIPGTNGQEYLAIPVEEVYLSKNQRTYFAVLEKAKDYPIFNRNGELLEKRKGEDLKNWEKYNKEEGLQKTVAKKLANSAPMKK